MQELIQNLELSADLIELKTREIHARVMKESHYLDHENFTVIHPYDLQRMFDLYDQMFFQGGCRKSLGDTPLSFRLSRRMTRVAGTTTRRVLRGRHAAAAPVRYEIAISTTLLFQTFREEVRPIMVNGIQCLNRIDALQRVMEHEIIHLIEMLIWSDSSCTASRFQSIAHRFFNHTQHTHQLITPRERAFTKYGIKAGDRVTFRFEGRHHEGIVNRITKRATVLVEDQKGTRYTDGKMYRKFYVPVQLLRPAEPS